MSNNGFKDGFDYSGTVPPPEIVEGDRSSEIYRRLYDLNMKRLSREGLTDEDKIERIKLKEELYQLVKAKYEMFIKDIKR